MGRGRFALAIKMKSSADIQECLVDRDALDIGRIMFENLKRLCGDFLVEFHMGTDEDRVGTLLVGRPRGHGGMDAELARFVGAGGDDAAFVGTGSDDNGPTAPLGMVQELDGREERVHIDMEDRRHCEDYTIL